jgi:hypothetical protein
MSRPVEAYPGISNAFQSRRNGLCNMNATWLWGMWIASDGA